MKYFIITNNSLVSEKFDEVIFIEGSVEDVLKKVRDYVHKGYDLISHPLPASLRMLFSPCRSIMMGQQNKDVDYSHVEIIEDSILKLKKHMGTRKFDEEHSEDYKIADLALLQSAIKDIKGK